MSDHAGARLTSRLRLDPVTKSHADDLWLVHSDDEVWPWYSAHKPTRGQIERRAALMDESWRLHGVHKWIAYQRDDGQVVGRGGLSRTAADADWGQIYEFLPDEPWTREAHDAPFPFTAHANWLEIGWAVRHEFRGLGYASEIGRAGLAFAFTVLGANAVVSCTLRHNAPSRAVMERIGMRYAGEIKSRGLINGATREQDDAPYVVHVLLRDEWQGVPATGASRGQPRATEAAQGRRSGPGRRGITPIPTLTTRVRFPSSPA
ncbi:hypothetical protein GCM10023175_15480 [Pseudonocardia xishanensis]|uniref:N-acetyltransferase domain-containing protein n=1 Tax=Pseudonocardia xishanensis TaxID=630995 RepID=A0ABP8RKP3_9PSEU